MAIYLDYAASAPIRGEILENYVEQLRKVGNPSSVHGSGQSQRQIVEEAREKLAKIINCHRSEVLFTSGGTESDNLAIKGLFLAAKAKDPKRNICIFSNAEHHAGIDPFEFLAATESAELVIWPIDSNGSPDLEWLSDFLEQNSERVALVSAMWANNETGVIWPIREITKLAEKHKIPVHSDAVAAFGHTPLDFAESHLSTMSISGHKIGAPVGIGAIIVGRSANLSVISHGGGQERGIRSGTLSAPLAVAFADAAGLAVSELDSELPRLQKLQDKLVSGIKVIAPNSVFSRGTAPGLPGITNFTFPGCRGDSLLFLLDKAGISVSTGSACRAGIAQPSHVLIAMGRTEAEAYGALRISIGLETTETEVDAFLAALPEAYAGAVKAGLPTN
ncbi:MAG: cysteine desulfurase family protein [Rhodoluna sp.]